MKKILIFVLLVVLVVAAVIVIVTTSKTPAPVAGDDQTVFVPAGSGDKGGQAPSSGGSTAGGSTSGGSTSGSSTSGGSTSGGSTSGGTTSGGTSGGTEPSQGSSGGSTSGGTGGQSEPSGGSTAGQTETPPSGGSEEPSGGQGTQEPGGGAQEPPQGGTETPDPEPVESGPSIRERVSFGRVPAELTSTEEENRLLYSAGGDTFFEIRFLPGVTAMGILPSFLDGYLDYTEIEFLDLEPMGAQRLEAEHLTARSGSRTADAWLLNTNGGVLSFVISYTEGTDGDLVSAMYALLNSVTVQAV